MMMGCCACATVSSASAATATTNCIGFIVFPPFWLGRSTGACDRPSHALVVASDRRRADDTAINTPIHALANCTDGRRHEIARAVQRSAREGTIGGDTAS